MGTRSGILVADPLTAGAGAALRALERDHHDLIEQLERLTLPALSGREDAARGYVGAWRALRARLLRIAHDARPEAVSETPEGGLVVLDADGTPAPAALELLDHLAVSAPFSPWVALHGPGRGVALSLLAAVREAVPGLPRLAPPQGSTGLAHWDVELWDFQRFSHHAWIALHEAESPLGHVAAVFDLSTTELARLFGVRRQAVQQWFAEGVPPARQAKLAAVAHIADLLQRNLVAERIPGIARAPAAAYGDLTMLEMIAAGRHEELLDLVAGSFDWSWTA